jgi:hypothetical protein
MANDMNCIIYLVRSSDEDVEMFNKSLSLLEKNLFQFTSNTDIIIFIEESFEQYKSKVKTNLNLNYQIIEFKIPDYSQKILGEIPEFFPHPTHGNGPIGWGHPGFTLGYRHMCRFFSGDFYKIDILKKYNYYLRLDTDSYINTSLNYDIFEWAEMNECYYGYIHPAVQKDNPKVIENLWNYVNLKYPNNIPEGLMFYTNFELGKMSWFLESEYLDFFEYLDESGGFYTKRWGDAPVKFLGVNLLMDSKNIVPVKGFEYQHGGVYTV